MTFPADAIQAPVQNDQQLDSLANFFDEIHRIWPRDPVTSEQITSLEQFLTEFHILYPLITEPEIHAPEALPNRDAFAAFCNDFGSQYAALLGEGEFIDFWTVADLGHDELRHAKVLAWFLKPLETHGFGDSIFKKWVSKLKFSSESRLTNLADWHGDYRVATEVCPFSDRGDRFDIEIDGKDFYLCVEVKINAPEGESQLDRYHESARKKAASRPFSVVYLTPERPARKSTDSPFIVATTWREFANSVRGSSHAKSRFPDKLISQFLKRVEAL